MKHMKLHESGIFCGKWDRVRCFYFVTLSKFVDSQWNSSSGKVGTLEADSESGEKNQCETEVVDKPAARLRREKTMG